VLGLGLEVTVDREYEIPYIYFLFIFCSLLSAQTLLLLFVHIFEVHSVPTTFEKVWSSAILHTSSNQLR